MAALYPSLEDMKVDQYQQAQIHAHNTSTARVSQLTPAPPAYSSHASSDISSFAPAVYPESDLKSVYPSLNEEYMGLRLEPPSGPLAPPQLSTPYPTTQALAMPQPQTVAVPASTTGGVNWVAPLAGATKGLARANVTHGVREVLLCKDGKGKMGLRVKSVDKGVFVQFVSKDSPAALAGLRFGDQILQINGENVAGFSTEKAMEKLKKADAQRITMAVRDRPFERTITLHKDSAGRVGFQFHDNEITALVKDSSAARNGLLIQHHILEVDGQNVVGMNTKELTAVFQSTSQCMTLTIMPSFVYQHIIKCMGESLMQKAMDRSIPEV